MPEITPEAIEELAQQIAEERKAPHGANYQDRFYAKLVLQVMSKS